MAKVLVAVADGSEEMEVVIVVDVLRRAGLEVTLASVMEERKILASRGVALTADTHIAYCENKVWDMVVLPGGLPGAEHLAGSEVLLRIIRDQQKAESWLAAICAAPLLVLAAKGLIKGASATCFPALQARMAACDVRVINEPVVHYKKLITSQGAGTAIAFALALVRALKGDVAACDVAQAMVFAEV
jgi:4-methyl-5(b-hydroxyethyl)-thiazole monophosphate biosynthesis